jgi:hypothetical protein
MWASLSASSKKTYFPEGQIFRMFFNPASALQTYYGIASGIRACSTSTDPLKNPDLENDPYECPDLHERIWPDGAQPASVN